MTFTEFCYVHNLSASDRDAFRAWLGSLGDEVKTEWEWLRLFAKFLKDDETPRRAIAR